jgi:hypothetical protein
MGLRTSSSKRVLCPYRNVLMVWLTNIESDSSIRSPRNRRLLLPNNSSRRGKTRDPSQVVTIAFIFLDTDTRLALRILMMALP